LSPPEGDIVTSANDPSVTEPFVDLDRNGLIVLSRTECVRLLSQATFGRVAVSMGALPVILPVNYRLIDDRIVFRTSPGSKLDAATTGAVVSFEVDSVEPLSHAGWSVIVTGIAAEVTTPAALAAIAEHNVPCWAHGAGDRIVEVPLTLVSGRLLVPGLRWDDDAPGGQHRALGEFVGMHVGVRVAHGPAWPLG
jgi:hypothetical protein